jgi:hypothetical protein
MSNTFVKLPTGDIEIEHIREVYEDLKGSEFQYMEWKPRAALIEKIVGLHGFTPDRSSTPNTWTLLKMVGHMTIAKFVQSRCVRTKMKTRLLTVILMAMSGFAKAAMKPFLRLTT